MTRLLVFVFILFVPNVSLAQDFDFRQVRWGMSVDEVKAAEIRAELKKEEIDLNGLSFLYYRADLDSKKWQLTYVFLEGELAEASYILTDRLSPASKYIEAFNDMMALLTTRYGKPFNEETIWAPGSLFKDDPERLGMAYTTGEVHSIADWESQSERTLIRMYVGGQNLKGDLEIYYYYSDTIPAIEEYRRKQSLSDL